MKRTEESLRESFSLAYACSELFITPQEPHKRSQLWRLTGGGLLRHEGSSPPTVKPSSANAGLVLDIDSLAPPTCGKYVRLVLSKPNPRRMHSQTWSFTEVNRNLIFTGALSAPSVSSLCAHTPVVDEECRKGSNSWRNLPLF